ncbi:MAG: hypothetical protein L3J75_00235 [Methylococcaceae bacterium]|nr:hypothetical protein [Methylococcaceae bacterium]
MFTQSLASSFSFPQPTVRGFEADQQSHARNNGLAAEKPNIPQNRLLEDTYQPTPPPTQQTDTNNSEVVSSKMAVLGLATSKSQSVDIQVTTQEGDVVTISLNQSVSSSVSAFQAENENTKVTAYAEDHALESSFSMSIEGDLNDNEQESLAKLIKKMSKVSDKFFKGNIESAFKHAQKVGFDTEQIAGFSLDLKMDKSVQAVAAYQQTTMPEQNINTDLLKQAGDFLAETKAFMADTGAMLDSFSEPKQAFTDLFSAVAQLDGGADKEIDNNSGDQALFSKMIEHITNALFSKEVDGHDDIDKNDEIEEHDKADEHDDD